MEQIIVLYAIIIILLMYIILKDHIDDYIGDEDDSDLHPDKINEELINIIKDKRKKLINKLSTSCKEGFMRGCITGCLSGGFGSALSGGILFGMANPIMTYIQYTSDKKK